MIEIVGYKKRKGINLKNLQPIFEKKDFENRTPIIKAQNLKLFDVSTLGFLIFQDEMNRFYIDMQSFDRIKEKTINEASEIEISGYFEINMNSIEQVTIAKFIPDIEKFKEVHKENWFKNDLELKLRLVKDKKTLTWVKLEIDKTVQVDYNSIKITKDFEEITYNKSDIKKLKGKVSILEFKKDKIKVLKQNGKEETIKTYYKDVDFTKIIRIKK